MQPSNSLSMVDYSNIPRDSRRVPLETRVQFKFDRFDGFISEYSSNVSPGGLFLRTRAPQPPGTVLDFEFRLGDGFELIRGRGEVVWNRLEDEEPARPAGMGLRFLELSEGSKDLIYRIVDQHVMQGGTPFDVTQRPPDPGPLSTPPRGAAPGPRPAPLTSKDVFDLPPPPAPASASSWLPSIDEHPDLGASPAGEPFPDLVLQTPPAPAPDEPPMFAPTFGHAGAASTRPPRRMLPWVLLAAGVVLAAGLFLLRDRVMGWVGLGGGDEVAQAPPPQARPKKLRRTAPGAPGAPAAAAPEPSSAPPATTTSASPPPLAAAGGPAQTSTAPSVAPAAPTPAPKAPPAPAPASSAPSPKAPFPAVPEDTGPPLTALEKITFEAAGGGTDVILWGNGAIPASVYTQSRIEGNPPRELFRLSGLRQPFGKPRLVVGTPEVLQIRTGFHTGTHGNEVHIVLDLANPGVKVTQVEPGPQRLRIHLQRK
jgi:molecular chaperone DnaK